MDLYPWSFDSIHPHCHDDMIIFLKEFLIIWAIARYRAPPRRVKKKQVRAGPRLYIYYYYYFLYLRVCTVFGTARL
jgi:hypothetical protein